MGSEAKAKPKARQSLVDFLRAKKRAACPVCRLPETVRAELAAARSKKIHRREQLEWLATECGIKLTGADFDAHYSGKHDNGA